MAERRYREACARLAATPRYQQRLALAAQIKTCEAVLNPPTGEQGHPMAIIPLPINVDRVLVGIVTPDPSSPDATVDLPLHWIAHVESMPGPGGPYESPERHITVSVSVARDDGKDEQA